MESAPNLLSATIAGDVVTVLHAHAEVLYQRTLAKKSMLFVTKWKLYAFSLHN